MLNSVLLPKTFPVAFQSVKKTTALIQVAINLIHPLTWSVSRANDLWKEVGGVT